MRIMNDAYQYENSIVFDPAPYSELKNKKQDKKQKQRMQEAPKKTKKGVLIPELILGKGDFF